MSKFGFILGSVCLLMLSSVRPTTANPRPNASTGFSLSSLGSWPDMKKAVKTVNLGPNETVSVLFYDYSSGQLVAYENGSQFLNMIYFDGSQRIVFGIFDYNYDVYNFFQGSSFIDYGAIYLLVNWLAVPVTGAPLSALFEDFNEKASQAELATYYIEWLISDLNTYVQVDPSKIEFFTSGLGSQSAALYGSRNPGVASIIAHEPAARGFIQLNTSHASYVSVVHVNSDEYGVQEAIGHADYYLLGDPEASKFSFGGSFVYSDFLLQLESPPPPTTSSDTSEQSRNKREVTYEEEVIRAARRALPRAYACRNDRKFLNGGCFGEYSPIPLMPIVVDLQRDVGVFYHKLSSFNAYKYLDNEILDFTKPFLNNGYQTTLGYQIRVQTKSLSPRNEGLLEAKIVFPYIYVFGGIQKYTLLETEFQPIVDNDNVQTPGINSKIFSVPYILGGNSPDFFNSFYVSLRYRSKIPFENPYTVNEIAVSLPYLVNPYGYTYTFPTSFDVTFRACDITFIEQTEIQLDLMQSENQCPQIIGS